MRKIEDLKFRLWSTQRKLWLAMGMTIVDFQQDASMSTEVRPYCRPSLVNYDVFPVFKEAVEYLKGKRKNDA